MPLVFSSVLLSSVAITKHMDSRDLNNRLLFSHSPGGRKSQIKVSQG